MLLTTLTDEASQDFGFGYDNADRMTSRTMPNGITSTFDYDNMSRLKRLKHQSTSATLVDNQYTYNTASQISQIAELTQTKNFTYDNVDRLTGMTNGTMTESYTYDDVGNRTASHLSASYGYQTGQFNQLTSTATGDYQFDANGNTVRKSEGQNFWRYTWDYENRLTEASTRKEKARYKYDALGRRVERNLRFSKERTRYTHDGLDVVMDSDAETGITKYQNGLGIDDKLKLSNGGNPSYFLQDHLGSTVGLANSTASVTSSTTYDSFGNVTSGNLANRYSYSGREFDSFTSQAFYRARFYDSKLGRFNSEDPIGFGGGDINLYGYVWNNPINLNDPFGLFGCWPLSQCADQLDGMIDNAINSTVGSDPIVSFGPLLRRPVRLSQYFKGPVRFLRIGSGSGAVMDADIPEYEKFEAYCEDFVDAGSLFLTMAGSVAGRVGVPKGRPRFPNSASAMDDFLGIEGKRIPDGPYPGRNKVVWQPSDKVKITLEQHPYHPNAPAYHSGPHYHVDTPGKRHVRYLPGEEIP